MKNLNEGVPSFVVRGMGVESIRWMKGELNDLVGKNKFIKSLDEAETLTQILSGEMLQF